jgi:hypothetical protein
MSKILLINNETNVPAPAAGVTNPSEVAEAEVVAFNVDDYSTGTLDLDAATTVDRVVFVQGVPTGETPIFSPVFNVSDIKYASQVKTTAYQAPVAQVTTVTVDVTTENTGVATLRVVRADAGFMPHERVTVETTLDGKTATQVAAALVVALNNNSQTFVTATSSGAAITLTGATGVSFETSLDDYTNDWTIAATTTPNFGTGTTEHVSNLEQIAYGGNYTNRIYLPVTPPSYVVAGKNYNLTTVRIPTNTTPNISSANAYVELIIAVTAGGTGINLNTFFGV